MSATLIRTQQADSNIGEGLFLMAFLALVGSARSISQLKNL